MTKRISLLAISASIFFACAQKTPKKYVSIQGKIENNKDSTIAITSRAKTIKTIKVSNDGTFKDTLKISNPNVYTIQINNYKRAPIYLKNGFDLTMKANSDDFFKTFDLDGEGADNSNYILAQLKFTEKISNPDLLFNLKEEKFKKEISALEFSFDSILKSYNQLDSTLISMAKSQNQQILNYFKQNFASKQLLKKGTTSPVFENYIDYNGGKKSLSSFKGKYVYIDLWATWCGPCIMQIPYLKILEKEYHNKNIEFVSISTDEHRRSGGTWEAAEKKWRKFVKEKELTGVQLWAGKDISFQQAYQVNGIPRFILIDKQGKIINSNAPRPSEPALRDLLDSLDL